MRMVSLILAMLAMGACKFNGHNVSTSSKEFLLSGETYKLWRADRGESMLIRADRTLEEYYLRPGGVIEKPDYGDVLVDYTEWKVVGDTLKVGYGHQWSKYLILEISASSLTLSSYYGGYSDTTRYIPIRPVVYPKRYHGTQTVFW